MTTIGCLPGRPVLYDMVRIDRLFITMFRLARATPALHFARCRVAALGLRPLAHTPLRLSELREQPILHSKTEGPLKPDTPEPAKRNPFTPEEREAARLARLAGLGWLRHLPEKWIPYAELMRIEKPVGMLLLLVPSFWAITMGAYTIAAPVAATASVCALFTAGAVVMRGAGCTINDILDRNLDNQVARTVERPIASGRVSVPQAVGWLGVQLTAGLAVLLLLPFECFYLGALSLPFVATYPLFKRFTYYPQIWLSATFSWGCLLGFPAIGAPLELMVAGPLFFSNFLWSMIYDTVYAHQDKRWDVEAGVKSTALAWGENTKPILYTMFPVQVASYLTAGYMAAMGPMFYVGAAWGFLRMLNMIRKVDLDSPDQCGAFFKNNIRTGEILWLGILLDYLLKIFGYL